MGGCSWPEGCPGERQQVCWRQAACARAQRKRWRMRCHPAHLVDPLPLGQKGHRLVQHIRPLGRQGHACMGSRGTGCAWAAAATQALGECF